MEFFRFEGFFVLRGGVVWGVCGIFGREVGFFFCIFLIEVFFLVGVFFELVGLVDEGVEDKRKIRIDEREVWLEIAVRS